jgi:RNA 3'-terminal phosphate cyclase (ATP)
MAVGSSELAFKPGRVTPGEYHFAVGTAGSTGLVLQTVLMPLLFANAPSRLVLEGGTHNMLAPPFDFIARSFLPIINRMGPRVEARLVRHGFYPRGGGRIEIDIAPASLAPIDCTARGALLDRSATTLVAALPPGVAERIDATARKAFSEWPDEVFAIRELPVDQGPGVILMLEAAFENVTEVVSGFGKLGVPAERVATTAAARMQGYLESDAFAGPYLADQLLLPFALTGAGAFTTVKPSQHSRTAADVIERFIGNRPNFAEQSSGGHLVQVG